MTDAQAAANMAPSTDWKCVLCNLVIKRDNGDREMQFVNVKMHSTTHLQGGAAQGQDDLPSRGSQNAKMWDGFETWESDKFPKFSIKSND